MKSLFHLAYNVTCLEETRAFYIDLLNCKEGRSTDTWVDLDFFGHQLSLHLGEPFKVHRTGKVGEHIVPMPHLGVILDKETWDKLAKKLIDSKIEFIIEPSSRFVGEAGEQYTMFFTDPSGNPIEVKGFKNFEGVFES